MKLSEIDLGAYTYERIAILRPEGPEYCAPHAEDYILRTYGDQELAEPNGVTCADGWLTLKLVGVK